MYIFRLGYLVFLIVLTSAIAAPSGCQGWPPPDTGPNITPARLRSANTLFAARGDIDGDGRNDAAVVVMMTDDDFQYLAVALDVDENDDILAHVADWTFLGLSDTYELTIEDSAITVKVEQDGRDGRRHYVWMIFRFEEGRLKLAQIRDFGTR